jgi:8-oxo-dGTP diphosphatase
MKNLKSIIEKLVSQAQEQQVQRFVVGALIDVNDKVLCLKRASDDFMPGLYELPSGKVEDGESLLDALKRETKEESALDIQSIDQYLGYFDYTSGSGKLTRQFNFAVTATGRVQLEPKEHEGYAWLNSTEVKGYNISNEVKNAIEVHFLKKKLPTETDALVEQATKDGIARLVVGAIITDPTHKKALVMKRASDDFMGGLDELPSGKVEKGELLERALVREVKEETNLDISTINSYVGHFDYRSGSGVLTRQFTFTVSTKPDSELKLSPEHEGFAWMSAQEINRYQVSAEVKKLLAQFFTPGPAAKSDLFSNRKRAAEEALEETPSLKK